MGKLKKIRFSFYKMGIYSKFPFLLSNPNPTTVICITRVNPNFARVKVGPIQTVGFDTTYERFRVGQNEGLISSTIN